MPEKRCDAASTTPVVPHIQPRTSFFKSLSRPFAIAVGALALTAAAPVMADEEIEDRGVYYEDDAWYDISEWFDGNDYNPTDEVVGRWDNETYDASEDIGGDHDNDRWFGFDNRYRYDNWFYDYYDDGDTTFVDNDRDGVFNNGHRYHDYDGDGLYDVFVTYSDDDSDGTFDSFDTYWLNERARNAASSDRSNRSNSKSKSNRANSNRTWNSTFSPSTVSSKLQKVNGKVQNVKMASVNDSKHIVVKVKQNNGQTMVVDLGPVNDLDDFDITTNDRIQVRGPLAKVGDQHVVFAQDLRANGTSTTIKRPSRTVKGTVEDTRQVKLRGHQHLMAVIQRPNGKKCIADLGPIDQLDTQLREGAKVKLEGTMVNARDQRVFMCNTLHANGDSLEIERPIIMQMNRRSASGS